MYICTSMYLSARLPARLPTYIHTFQCLILPPFILGTDSSFLFEVNVLITEEGEEANDDHENDEEEE